MRIPLLRRMKSRLVLAKVSSPRLPSMDDVAVFRSEVVDDSGAPRTFHESLSVDDALEDSVRMRGDFVVPLGEGDRCVHHGDTRRPGRIDQRGGVREESVRFHDWCDGLVEDTALGGEVVLVLDEHDGGGRGIQFELVGHGRHLLCCGPGHESPQLKQFVRQAGKGW